MAQGAVSGRGLVSATTTGSWHEGTLLTPDNAIDTTTGTIS